MKFKIIKKYKIIIALSGGVDSSVTTWILKKLGFNVECIFMKNWEEDDNTNYCNSQKDYSDAKNICKQLNIKLHKINFSYEYWKKVFSKFIKKLKKAQTPNPDILCNKEIKFKLLLNFCLKILNADFLATGHYVIKKRIKDKFLLLKGIDNKKDQSYFLYRINQKQIKKIIFPLGNYYKKKIRQIAVNIKLINAKKKDSTGICYIGKKKYKNFIKKYIKNKFGNIINIKNNEIIGCHKGLFYYTIGQRKNLNIKKSRHKPYYVVKKNKKTNELIVAKGRNNKNLYSKGIFIKKIYFIHLKKKYKTIFCNIKIRHQQKEIPCKVFLKKKNKVLFKKPIFAISPGQSAVLYKKNICLGGGTITKNISL